MRTIHIDIFTITEATPASNMPVIYLLDRPIKMKYPSEQLTTRVPGQWTKEQGFRTNTGEVIEPENILEWYYYVEDHFDRAVPVSDESTNALSTIIENG